MKYAKNNFLAVYAADSMDAEQLQRELIGWVLETAGQRIHGTTAQRGVQVFSQEEKAALTPLTGVAYQPVVWRQVKVHTDSHVNFGRALYSVPWR